MTTELTIETIETMIVIGEERVAEIQRIVDCSPASQAAEDIFALPRKKQALEDFKQWAKTAIPE